MQISKEDMEKFKAIHLEETGDYLSEEEAYEIASRLIQLYTQLANKLPSEQKVTPTVFAPEK